MDQRTTNSMERLREILKRVKRKGVSRKVLITGVAAYFGRAAKVISEVNPDVLVVLKVGENDPFFSEEYRALYSQKGVEKLIEDLRKDGGKGISADELRLLEMELRDLRKERFKEERLRKPFIEWPEVARFREEDRYVDMEQDPEKPFINLREIVALIYDILGETADIYIDITNFPLKGRIDAYTVALFSSERGAPEIKVVYRETGKGIRSFDLRLYGPKIVLEGGEETIYLDHPLLELDYYTQAILITIYMIIFQRREGKVDMDSFQEEEVKSAEIRDAIVDEDAIKVVDWWGDFVRKNKAKIKPIKDASDPRKLGISISNKLHEMEKLGLIRLSERPVAARLTRFGYLIAESSIRMRNKLRISIGEV